MTDLEFVPPSRRAPSRDASALPTTEPVLLILADIGGYTRYMTANAKTLAHSQTIITELIHTIVEQISLPLEIAKLEGDAVFLFCRRPPDSLAWMEKRAQISRKLVGFFRLFHQRLHELSRSNHCTCHACTHIEKLRLKVIVHRGEVFFHQVLHFHELAGVDVIIAHRLLKNSVKAAQYLMLTEAAMHELQFPDTMTFRPHEETYGDLGRLKIAYHDFEAETGEVAEAGSNNFGARYRESLKTFLKLWFGTLTARRTFRNLPGSASRPARIGFALLTILLTPLMVPVVAVLGIFRAIK